MARIEAVKGDITDQDVDAIVNAANRDLAGGGGVDGAIWQAAGVYQMRQACRALGGCKVGQAKVTPGFKLKAKWVIHTVGPVWVGSGEHWGERVELSTCYRNCLYQAEEHGVRSIAFPAISTGVFRFPSDIAARIAVKTVRLNGGDLDLIRLVAYDDDTLMLYEKELANA